MPTDAEAKIQEEIALLRGQQRDLQARLWLDWAKVGLAIVAGLGAFLFLDRPGSILRRQATQEELTRERTKLLLEWLRVDDPDKRAVALGVIRQAYGDNQTGRANIDVVPGPRVSWRAFAEGRDSIRPQQADLRPAVSPCASDHTDDLPAPRDRPRGSGCPKQHRPRRDGLLLWKTR